MTNCFRFLTQNYTTSVAASYVSSESASYPVNNLYDSYRRNKVWRSAGYWDLSGGDLTLVFREAVGVDLTATLAADEYTTDALFLAAIKTALDAAGVATYTVARDTVTSKIKITSDLTGGATVFQLRMADAASLDMGAVMGFDAINLTGLATYTADELKIHTNEFIKLDLGYAGFPKAFVLSGPRNSPLKFSQSAVLRLQGNETNNFSNPSYNQVLDADDYVYFSHNENGLHTSGLRYWRLNIVDQSNPNLYVEAGLIYLGDSEAFDRGGPTYGFSTKYDDRSTTVFSEGGNEFTDIRPTTERFGLEIAGLNKTGVEKLDDYFYEFGLHTPFWLSMDTDSVFSSSQRRWVRLVKFDSSISHQLRSLNNFTANVDLREQL